jgi:hypothetical protein
MKWFRSSSVSRGNLEQYFILVVPSLIDSHLTGENRLVSICLPLYTDLFSRLLYRGNCTWFTIVNNLRFLVPVYSRSHLTVSRPIHAQFIMAMDLPNAIF